MAERVADVDAADAPAPSTPRTDLVRRLADAEAAAESLRQAYRELLDNANDIIYVHDLQGDFLSMNARGEQILGYSPDEIRGMNIADILADDQLALARRKIRSKVDGGGSTTYEIDVRAKSGEMVPLEVGTRTVVRDGRAVAVQGIARDVRERRAAQQALAESERRFRALTEHGGDVKMLLEPSGIVRYVSPSGERVLGYAAKERVGRSVFDIVHPDDGPRARALLTSLAGSGSEAHGELRVTSRDGAVRWLAFVAQNALHEPAIDAIVVSYFDITERKRNEQRLTELANFRDALVSLAEESLQDGLTEDFYGRVLRYAVDVIPGAQAGSLLVKDEDGRCHFVAAQGFELSALEGTFIYERELHRNPDVPGPQIVTGFEHARVEDAERSAVLFGPGRAGDIAVTMSIPIELEGRPVAYFHLDNFEDPRAFTDDALNMARAFSNHIAILLQRFRLEANLRQERAALDEMAYTDALTGLPNRNMFYRRASEALEASDDPSLAVLFFDLDTFKQVNDTHGHPFGDRLLQAVAGRLLGCVRDRDTVSRWGGDEFVLLLLDAATVPAVAAMARRIIDRINAPFALGDRVLTIGCSIGIAMGHAGTLSIDELTREADIALYRAKEGGRNRFCVFSSDMRVGPPQLRDEDRE